MVCFLFSLSVHLAPDWTMESCNESVSPLETRCLSCPRFLSERDKAAAKSGGTSDTHWLLFAIRPPFVPLFYLGQVISWSIKHFSGLKWNKMRVFQKHFHNFLAVVRIPHCDFLVCLTWIRPIPPKSPPRYSVFYPIFPKYILDFRGQTSYWFLGYILKCEWLSLVEWNPLYDLAWFVSQPSKI